MNAGLTTFDTADIYGPSESILGQFRGAWEGKKPAGAGSPEARPAREGGDSPPPGSAAVAAPSLALTPPLTAVSLPATVSSHQIFTKYVPNIFQQRPTKTAVENAIKRSLTALRVDSLDLVQLVTIPPDIRPYPHCVRTTGHGRTYSRTPHLSAPCPPALVGLPDPRDDGRGPGPDGPQEARPHQARDILYISSSPSYFYSYHAAKCINMW